MVPGICLENAAESRRVDNHDGQMLIIAKMEGDPTSSRSVFSKALKILFKVCGSGNPTSPPPRERL